MSKPGRYLTNMTFFLAVVVAVAVALVEPMKDAFFANAWLNGFILIVFLFGIILIFRQVISLKSEIAWVDSFRKSGGENGGRKSGDIGERPVAPIAAPPPKPKLLAPMAALLEGEQASMKLSSHSLQSLLDSIASRLDEERDTSRYLIGLLVFLGLLGTFWGLLGTIGAIGDTIRSLSVTSSDFAVMFDDLKRGLQAPLDGMGTAFSSSLFGLAGSVALGFLDLQAGQAQNRFYNDLEEWLSTQTRLTRAGPSLGVGGGGGEGAPSGAYLTALMEQSAESLEALQRTIRTSEDGRRETNDAILGLSERLAQFADQMKADRDAILTIREGQASLSAALEKLGDSLATGSLDEASREHLRNMDVHLKRLTDNETRSRDDFTDVLRSEFRLLSRTIGALAESQSGSGNEGGG